MFAVNETLAIIGQQAICVNHVAVASVIDVALEASPHCHGAFATIGAHAQYAVAEMFKQLVELFASYFSIFAGRPLLVLVNLDKKLFILISHRFLLPQVHLAHQAFRDVPAHIY
jgi:hypothetical protein